MGKEIKEELRILGQGRVKGSDNLLILYTNTGEIYMYNTELKTVYFGLIVGKINQQIYKLVEEL